MVLSRRTSGACASSSNATGGGAGVVTKFHPFAEKMPPPRKTGNKTADADDEAKMVMLKELLSECLNDLSLVVPCYATLRLRLLEASVDIEGQEFSGVKQFRNLDPDFLIEHVEKWSGLSVQVLVGLLKNDQLAIVQMASFATGLPVGLKWSGELFDKVVASRFLDQRAVFLGGRLKQAVGENLVKDQQLNWSMGCYRLLFNESGRMDYVLFVNGDKVPVGKDVFIFKNAVSLTDNYSDTSAALLQPPHEPLKLINFFLTTGLGPFKFKLFAKKECRVRQGSQSGSHSPGG